MLSGGIIWHLFVPVKKRMLWASTFVLNWLALGLTYSRSSFLGLFFSLVVMLFFIKPKKLILLSLCMVLILPALLPRSAGGEGVKLERIASVDARLHVWETGLKVWKEHFWVGIGMNNYRMFTDTKAPDSSLLFIAVTSGVVGLCLAIMWLIELFKLSSTRGKVFLVAILVHSLFLNSLWFPPVMVLLALLCLQPSYSHKHQLP
jgi:O-antigen ligase